MIVASYESVKFGVIDVVFSDISFLFEKYEDVYAAVFKLNREKLLIAHKFKISRGGDLIELVSGSETLAIFTFGRVCQNHLELGDVIKMRYKLLREDYAKGLRLASQYLYDRGEIIVGYPNEEALKMELLAGYEVVKKYVRNISFVFFGLTVRLPVKIVSRKIYLNFEDWLCHDLIRFSRQYHGTAHRVFRLRIMTRVGFREQFSKPTVGFLYEYIETEHCGDSFICYKGYKQKDTPFGIEYSDNSA